MNEIEEIFVDIDGYEGKYQVSNWGNVKSLIDSHGNPREKSLKFGKDKGGYLHINLCKNGKKKAFLVHRLVANSFIENPSNLPQVNHKDENKENNCVENLEWCNVKYNSNYGTGIQRKIANTDYKAISEKTSKKVYQYSLDGELIKIWQSTRECGRNGYYQGNVSACCRGERKTHKGYIWSYVELKK